MRWILIRSSNVLSFSNTSLRSRLEDGSPGENPALPLWKRGATGDSPACPARSAPNWHPPPAQGLVTHAAQLAPQGVFVIAGKMAHHLFHKHGQVHQSLEYGQMLIDRHGRSPPASRVPLCAPPCPPAMHILLSVGTAHPTIRRLRPTVGCAVRTTLDLHTRRTALGLRVQVAVGTAHPTIWRRSARGCGGSCPPEFPTGPARGAKRVKRTKRAKAPTHGPRAHTGRNCSSTYSNHPARSQWRNGRATRRPGRWRRYYSTSKRRAAVWEIRGVDGRIPAAIVHDGEQLPSRWQAPVRMSPEVPFGAVIHGLLPVAALIVLIVSLLPNEAGVEVGHRAVAVVLIGRLGP